MSNHKKLPYMSVVVICHNGASTIARTLDSLLAQDYPKKKFEVIVVDDASTDTTPEIVISYTRVRYVRLDINQGIPGARNEGIAIARGDIYVSFDDDSMVHKDWLRQLAKGYTQGNPAGVGGSMSEPTPMKGIVQKYISATGNGAPAAPRKNASIGGRLLQYVVSTFRRPMSIQKERTEVEELYGANASYPMDVIRRVGGYDRGMSALEDRDISRRIRTTFPDRPFYAMRDAKIIHDPHMSLGQYLLRQYKRGPSNLKFHQRYNILPPIFPFPIIALLLATYAGFFQHVHVITTLLVVPQLLYFKWLLNFFKTGKLINLIFPYLQLTEEGMVILGLIRGYMINLKTGRPVLEKSLRISVLASLGLAIGWSYLTLHSQAGPLRAISSMLFLLIVPGYFLYRTIVGYPAPQTYNKLIPYSVGLSVIVLMLVSLGVNEILQLFGNQQPLTVRSLVYAVAGSTILFIIGAAARKPTDLTRRKINLQAIRRALPVLLVGALLPVMAVGGAITLNNGGTNWLALSTMGLAGLYFLALVWSRNKEWAKLYPYALYTICLSILLGTSMRGWHITGHDIMQEYQVFELTLRHSAWHMSYYRDAYNACLSITLLPTILQKITGITDPYIYKFVFQVFFALIAPVVYNLARTFTTRKVALLAAFVFMTFPAFLTDITMLNRQEVALFCLALALQAGLDTKLKRRQKSALLLVFLTGMVLSHYSTSYVAMGTLLIMVGLRVALLIVRKIFKVKSVGKKELQLFSIPIILSALVILLTWGGFATQTSGNISRTLRGVVTGLPTLLSAPQSSSSRTGRTDSSSELVKEYLTKAEDNRTLPAQGYYPKANAFNASIQQRTDTISPLNKELQSHGLTQDTLYKIIDTARQFYGLLIEGLIGIGIGVLLLVRTWRKKINGQYQLLIIASLCIIGVQVLTPASLINYGLLRVIQQGLIVLALPFVLACLWLLGLIRIPTGWRVRIIGAAFVAYYLVLSGFVPAITGGYKPALPLSNSGFYYEAYYTHQDEIAADNWVATKIPKGSRVYSDEFARRRMIAYTGIFAQPTLAPVAIPIDSYVYLSNGNVATDSVPVYYNGALLYYQVPYNFLNANKNLVYSSGNVKIYR